jgi:hypothetical protein
VALDHSGKALLRGIESVALYDLNNDTRVEGLLSQACEHLLGVVESSDGVTLLGEQKAEEPSASADVQYPGWGVW